MAPSCQLSIVIPAYNEELRLPKYLSEVLNFLEADYGNQAVEVLVVDDGSSDGTAAVAEAMDNGRGIVRVLRQPRNGGKGLAVRTGMLAASGDLRLFADADGATPIAELAKLIGPISQGQHVVVASRALHADGCKVSGRMLRKFLGGIFNLFVRNLAVPGIHDTQCGFKLFRGEAADRLFGCQRICDFGFDVEILFLARKLGYPIREVPVNWSDVAGSKVNVLLDSFRMLNDIIKIRTNWSLGRYRTKCGS